MAAPSGTSIAPSSIIFSPATSAGNPSTAEAPAARLPGPHRSNCRYSHFAPPAVPCYPLAEPVQNVRPFRERLVRGRVGGGLARGGPALHYAQPVRKRSRCPPWRPALRL